MAVRAVRGAITVSKDTREDVLAATERLLRELLDRNDLEPVDVISVIFTATPDIRSAFPAEAGRRMGLSEVPLMCMREMDVDAALGSVVRVLMHFETDRGRSDVAHVYLEGARSLRDDLG